MGIDFNAGIALGLLLWALFPLRMLIDRSLPRRARYFWALACAVAPVFAYVIFLIVRAVQALPNRQAPAPSA